jgi:predicted PurR-regulated permease PerM
MIDPNESQRPQEQENGWLTRERILVLSLIVISLIVFYLCFRILEPFFAPLTWALALAIVVYPMHAWIARKIHKPSIAAAVSIAIIAIAIVAPAVFMMQSVVMEAAGGIEMIQKMTEENRWREAVDGNPQVASLVAWAEQQFDLKGMAQQALAGVTSYVSKLLSGSVNLIMGLLITFFILFYFFRDRDKVMRLLRSLMPLSQKETNEMFTRISDTVSATIYGTFIVSMVQGILGGLMFWWLGLPAPILWGFVMGLLGIVPVLGAFVVWIPAAILLALEGEWTKALILTAWGGIVIALIDNLLYPIFVGKKLKIHTLLIFFSILGGLFTFGASGLILGPLILAVADALLHVWKQRTAHGKTAETMKS